MIMSEPVHAYIALFDFNSPVKGDLSFKAGDRLQVVKTEKGWWQAEKINSDGSITGEKGLVPSNYLAEEGTKENKTDDGNSGLSDKYVSVIDFQATAEDDLTVKARERLQVLSMEKDRWLVSRVQVTGDEDTLMGYVPCVHLVKEKPVEEQSWFTKIDGAEAETLLLSETNINGSFLVRPSKDSGYCLSVSRNKEVLHYIIKKEDTGKVFIFEERLFTCVHDLVHYYRYHLKDHNCLPLTPFLKVPSQSEDPGEKPLADFTLMKKVKSNKAETFEICLWEGKWADGDRKVLIQTISEEFFEKNNFMRGIEIHKTLSHRNVTKLYALCTTQDPIYVVTEFMEKGDLQTFLHGEEGLHLEEAELMYIAQQVADAMAYLEVKCVRHLDLNGRNILVGNNLLCKVSQFGLSKKGMPPTENKDEIPVRWMPPEVLEYSEFSDKIDVWSFGIVLYEIFTLGQHPYKGLTSKVLATKLKKGYRLPMPPLCTNNIYRLMLECWNEEANKRPSFQKIVERKILDNHKRFGISDKYLSVKDWQATGKDEISIKAKERFRVHSMEKNRWLVSKVDVTGGDVIRGYVPCDYLVREKSLEEQSWFSDVYRAEAETLLLSQPNGSFLVRPRIDSLYCLSVRNNKGVMHYAIKRGDTGRFFSCEERSFIYIHDLVIYYQHHLKNHGCLPLIPFIKDPSHMQESWERPSSDFTLEEKLCWAKFTEMSFWKGKLTEGRRKVLVQTISKEFLERRNVMVGIEILKKLNHKNIIELYALCTTKDPVYIVTEIMEKGDLLSFLRE
ncbi:tyrosine-protein kinase Srms-like isoform X2 [Aquarana catesbeiana]|uniref:tyrosine-protein kinase Srms-like isoform X2 n=1 Tax=Aquarana catesbeiana TaxID=8400 RepID=UPI003CC9FA09